MSHLAHKLAYKSGKSGKSFFGDEDKKTFGEKI